MKVEFEGGIRIGDNDGILPSCADVEWQVTANLGFPHSNRSSIASNRFTQQLYIDSCCKEFPINLLSKFSITLQLASLLQSASRIVNVIDALSSNCKASITRQTAGTYRQCSALLLPHMLSLAALWCGVLCCVGTSMNPMLRAAHLAHGDATRKVLLVVPWVDLDQQTLIYPHGMSFETRELQAEYILKGRDHKDTCHSTAADGRCCYEARCVGMANRMVLCWTCGSQFHDHHGQQLMSLAQSPDSSFIATAFLASQLSTSKVTCSLSTAMSVQKHQGSSS